MLWHWRGIDSAWSDLRAQRSAPPGRAVEPDRRAVFGAALEQAEQLFRAAQEVGAESRPLLAFYGLSQAGRAIAAAASNDDWKLVGHGITAPSLNEKDTSNVRVQSRGKPHESFRWLSFLLKSPDLTVAVPLHRIWDSLPETALYPLVSAPDRLPPIPFTFHFNDNVSVLAGSTGRIPRWIAGSEDPKTELRNFLSHYPKLGDYGYSRTSADPEAPPKILVHGDVDTQVDFHWPRFDPANPLRRSPTLSRDEQLTMAHEVATETWNGWVLLPELTPGIGPIHPLLSWWAVLYTLSMLARYQADRWTAAIDVDASPYAVPLERGLEDALRVCPELILLALKQVSS